METATTKPLGALLPGIVDQAIAPMASPPPSTTRLTDLDLTRLPRRLDDGTMATLREIANSPLPPAQHCDDEHFARCMKALDILPRRRDDEIGGQLKFGIYKRHLGGFSNDAMSWLVSEATRTMDWFPTPAQCLTVLRAWPNRDVAAARRDVAQSRIQQENQSRLEDALDRLGKRQGDQAWIDVLPEQWKAIAAERCFLWAWPDGRYTVRHAIEMMPPEQQEQIRAENAAMFAEWETIAAALEAERSGD